MLAKVFKSINSCWKVFLLTVVLVGAAYSGEVVVKSNTIIPLFLAGYLEWTPEISYRNKDHELSVFSGFVSWRYLYQPDKKQGDEIEPDPIMVTYESGIYGGLKYGYLIKNDFYEFSPKVSLGYRRVYQRHDFSTNRPPNKYEFIYGLHVANSWKISKRFFIGIENSYYFDSSNKNGWDLINNFDGFMDNTGSADGLEFELEIRYLFMEFL